MSLIFLNPFDSSGQGLYSKTLKDFVQCNPFLAKKKQENLKSRNRYRTQQNQEGEHIQPQNPPSIIAKSTMINRKNKSKLAEPFSKSLSRQQRVLVQDGKDNSPAVGAYRPRVLSRAKNVWNILGVYQKTLLNRKQIQSRRERASRSLSCIKTRTKDNTKLEESNYLDDERENPQNQNKILNSDTLKYKNSKSFVQMRRMLGRQSARSQRAQHYQTVESQIEQTFVTSQTKRASTKGALAFNKQVSRQKASSLLMKKNAHLQYECNYKLVCNKNTNGPDFKRMVNRQGKGIESENNHQQIPDYSEIWLNRTKSSLPNLELILQQKIKRQRLQQIKKQAKV